MSDSSDLSSAPSDDEMDLQLKKKDGILKFFSKVPKSEAVPRVEISPPPRRKREPSPEHVPSLADNPDIAFIVMFRSRFTEAFPKSCPHFGPQELETDIVDNPPGDRAEALLCALLGLLLNRKQDVKAGHYNRALEEAIAGHRSQWPKTWEKSPLSGGATFGSMIATERLELLRTMIHWTLSSSDVVKAQITSSYKQNRHEDDLNQALSVQPWGSDGDKRRYYLIEGLDDTHFRVFRESNHLGTKRLWHNKAGSIDELKALAEKLELEDGGQKARLLASKMNNAVPRFEATEEKRKKREYRQARKQQFKRPEPGFSMYEGRTRGKRMKYTYEEEDDYDMYSDSTSARRSTRNTRGHTPTDGPTVTQSGRQVKQRQGGLYGESALSGLSHDVSEDELADGDAGRSWRSRSANGDIHAKAGRVKIDDMSSDEDDASEIDYGGDESEGDDNAYHENADEEEEDDADEEMNEDLLPEEEAEKKSLIIKLPVKTPTPEPKSPVASTKVQQPPPNPEVNPQQKQSVPVEIPAKPVEIPTMHAPVPGSPLAFRESPSKPSSFPTSVNVN